jgi:hypothetical protein
MNSYQDCGVRMRRAMNSKVVICSHLRRTYLTDKKFDEGSRFGSPSQERFFHSTPGFNATELARREAPPFFSP